MTNTTLLGWQPPPEPLAWARPVIDESAAAGLTACSLPDGRAVAVWPLTPDVRFAVVPSMGTLTQTDSVPAADMHTALTAGSVVYRTTAFTIGGEVYFSALGDTALGDRFWVRIYKADDPLDPEAGWSLHGTVKSGIDYDMPFDFEGNLNVGQPIVLPGGRWVISAAHAVADPSLGGFTAREQGYWTSDDGGVTWDLRYAEPADGEREAPHSPPQIARDPSSGDLIATKAISQTETDTFVSSDGGETWTQPGYTSDLQRHQPFLDNGSDVYATDGHNPEGRIYRLDGTAWTQVASVWDDAMGAWGTVGVGGEAVKFIADRWRLWYFVGDCVAHVPGWHVGFVGARSRGV